MKIFSTILVLLSIVLAKAALGQDTFSLLAYDEESGAIVSTGASCIDGNAIPKGVHAISSILPGVGAIHTQSLYVPQNQLLGDRLLKLGLSAKPILDSLLKADIALMPEFRQYLVLTTGKDADITAYTGGNCYPWAGQWVGDKVVIAGNILIDSMVIIHMRDAYIKARELGMPITTCALSAMHEVAYPGADKRCLDAGLSSRSAFFRLAMPGDDPNKLSIDVAVPFPKGGKDPILLLEAEVEALLKRN